MKTTNFLHTQLIALSLVSFIFTACHHGENLRPEPPAKEHLDGLGFTEISYGGSLIERGKTVAQYNYDNYIVVHNPTDKPIYLDGLALILSSFAPNEYIDLGEYNFFSTHISASRIMLFPGGGTQYKVEPGRSVTIAGYALDHTKNRDDIDGLACDDSIDLSNADFEWCSDEECKDLFGEVNDKTPNLKTVYYDAQLVDDNSSKVKSFDMKPSTGTMIALVKLGVDYKELLGKEYRVDWQHTDITGEHSHTLAGSTLKLPNEWVLDAVVVCPMKEFRMAVVDKTIDAGYHGIVDRGKIGQREGTHKALFRKHDGKAFVDTNNSTVDFEVKQASLKK